MSQQVFSSGAGSAGFHDSSNVLDERLRSRKSPTEESADPENFDRPNHRVSVKFPILFHGVVP